MEMKRWVEDIQGIGGLDYFIFRKVPLRESALGPVIEINEKILEGIAARAILELGLPLRGREVRFLRKAMGDSLQSFSEKLNLTAAAVLKWEKAEDARLHPINEVAVRSLVAEEMNISIPGKYSALRGAEKTPQVIELKAG
jgi:hypothetical protein